MKTEVNHPRATGEPRAARDPESIRGVSSPFVLSIGELTGHILIPLQK